MSKRVTLQLFQYQDYTGKATHVLVELSQKLPDGEPAGKIDSASETLTLKKGAVTLEDTGYEQVFEFTVQPVVISPSVPPVPVGAPATFRSQGGSFVSVAQVVTTGSLIPKTTVYFVEDCPAQGKAKKNSAPVKVGLRARQYEVAYNEFQYYDLEDEGEAVAVEIMVYGVYTESGSEPVVGPRSYKERVINFQAVPVIADMTDVTRIDFQPLEVDLSSGTLVPYGNGVTRMATPGFFLTSVTGQTTGTPLAPVNSASNVQEQPVQVPQQSSSRDVELIPGRKSAQAPAAGRERKKGSPRP